ncbi:MAG: sugar transferase [Terrisporobacter sp.]|uniref:sugar transferase n=1 Tax=Terrisporobacter sp. TaxID=1965305 RepID=UPI002A912077|nr:sugar transferase [Terrisporobacter sp.]MDY6154501.1 sugar transferase [Terrisporobacter sp.]
MNNVGSTYIVDNEKIRLYSVTKKSMDLILSFIGLILLIPVFLILAILVKLDSKGPVFYAHTRKGKNRSDIKIYKFRTMYSNSDEIFDSFSDEQKEEYYKNFKLDNDPRVTKVGDFLRRTSLDEIPQLINVLKGDLSLVGPRPIVEKEICKYGQYADKLFSVIPGITGYWQSHGRSDTSYEERIEMDMYYIDNRSILLDIKIMFKTVISVIKKEGAV